MEQTKEIAKTAGLVLLGLAAALIAVGVAKKAGSHA